MLDLLGKGTDRGYSMIGVGLSAGLSGSRRARTVQDPLPALDLDWATNRSLPASYGPTPTFTRASTGTYFDGQGILKTAAVNGPRFSHTFNGTSWVSRGLLVEEQRTNSNTNSEDLTNASWSKYQVTISSNATTAPDGAATADKIVESSANDIHVVYSDFVVSASKTYSIFLKAAERTAATISFDTASTSIYLAYVFDLANGSISKTANTSTATASASIQNVGNGWYRCSVTISSIGNLDGNRGGRISPNTSNNPTIGSYGLEVFTGDTSKGIYAWGVQYEAGAFPTSYIPTTSASVTRSVDVCEMQTGSNVTNFFNPIEGTFVVEFDSGVPGTITKAAEIIALADSTNNNRIFFDFYTPDNAYRWYIDETPTGVSSSLKPGPYVGDYVTQKAAMCYKLNDLAISLNGAAPLTDTSQPMPININRMEIGYNTPAAGPNRYTGHFSRIRYYPVRLTNAKLQELST